MPFICLEGIDGVGKTTLRRELALYLEEMGISTLEIGQHGWLIPSVSKLIIDIRERRSSYSTDEIVRAYAADKIAHAQANIEPHLASHFILSDRYIFSDAAYMEALHGISAEQTLQYHMDRKTLLPNIVFFVQAPMKVSMARIAKRAKPTKHYERPAELSKVQACYERIFVTGRIGECAIIPIFNIDARPREIIETHLAPHIEGLLAQYTFPRENMHVSA